MLIIQQTSTNPYFNIASEEYLLKNSTDDFFILYRNEPSIIVGKHQNTVAEINHQFVKQKGLTVIRRLSGGGTVYHDLGNLNYSFITTGSEGNLVNFKKHTQPIIDVLNSLGIDARIGGKNDIRVGDKKISGNAEHVYQNRVLHHGTLLFDSNLDNLNEAIQIEPKTYTDKAVKSIRSYVANISDYLNTHLTIDGFAQNTINHIKRTFSNALAYRLTEKEITSIDQLIKTKYATWEWNYGYSPVYTVNKQMQISNRSLNIQIVVENGFIVQVSLDGDLWEGKTTEIEQLLIGCKHDYDYISGVLNNSNPQSKLSEIPLDKILSWLF